jgi:TolB protein
MRLPVVLALSLSAPAIANVGAFNQIVDIGAVSKPTEASYEPTLGVYTVHATGEGIGGTGDSFGYVTKEMRAGDLSTSARVELPGNSRQPDRKAGIMLRQALTRDSPYVAAVVRGTGLTSLQYRLERGGETREIQCANRAPSAMRLEKRGDYVFLMLMNPEGIYASSGCVIKLAFKGRFFAGLALCACGSAAPAETALFKHVTLGMLPEHKTITYALEMVDADGGNRRVLSTSKTRIEAASFTADGAAICYRDMGNLVRRPLAPNAEPIAIDPANPEACETTYGPAVRAENLPAAAARGGRIFLPRRSPDGLSVVYLLGNGRGERIEEGDYLLRAIPSARGEPVDLARFYGDHSSLGTGPWSRDGRQIVFISHEPELD